MEQLILISFILSLVLGVLRGIDLVFFTNSATGLCMVGSVWLRYALLVVAVLVAVVAGRKAKPDVTALHGHSQAAGYASGFAAACFVLTGVTRLLFALDGVGAIVRALLELFCWVWLSLLARNWLRKGPWHRPTRSLYPAVAGSIIFYWCVLSRFMENSSSWHRVAPTAAVWQALAALVFLSLLIRALYLPESANGKNFVASAMTAFALCFCWEVPQVLELMLDGMRLTQLPELLFGLGLCGIGALGGICALNCTKSAAKQTARETRSEERR